MKAAFWQLLSPSKEYVMKNYKTELLAPAGNMEAFKGAVSAGADAIYLGGPRFGARAYADNFTTEELVSCIRYAHLFRKKVYLTVNTLMKDQELTELYDYLSPFYKAGLDAVIVQDLGVFLFIKQYFPDMELHVSTQMTVTGAYGMALLKELGASRVVPARELSLKEIIHMKEETGLEIETFIHGAMCYCYSGQCLFSSILGGRSGNRGRCAQPCRLPYSMDVNSGHKEDCYPLSLKDMCTIEHIGEFMDAGIDSFKIEGRMKKPEYAAGVTAIYRKYMDRKIKYPEKELKIEPKDLEMLSRLYIRSQRQDGYYYKQNGKDMVTLENPAYSGIDETLLAAIREKYIEHPLKKPISIYASFFCGSEVTLTCICEEVSVTVTGMIMEPAKSRPLTEETIEKQLRKLGDTCFEAEVIEISTDNQGFYPVKDLNELRRCAVHALEEKIILAYDLPASRQLNDEYLDRAEQSAFPSNFAPAALSDTDIQKGWTVLVMSGEQLQAVSENLHRLFITRIYVESELFLEQPNLSLPTKEVEIYIALPYIMRRKEEAVLEKLLHIAENHPRITGMLFRNLEEYGFLKSRGYTGKLTADANVYIWNQKTYQFWKEKIHSVTCPLELNKREWKNVFAADSIEKIVYGRIPMMVTANCIAKTGDQCRNGQRSAKVYLTDRYQKQFPVMLRCRYCTNLILNSVPLSLHGKENISWYDSVSKRISFTLENGAQVQEILKFFAGIFRRESVQPPFKEYTTGHEKRGVE